MRSCKQGSTAALATLFTSMTLTCELLLPRRLGISPLTTSTFRHPFRYPNKAFKVLTAQIQPCSHEPQILLKHRTHRSTTQTARQTLGGDPSGGVGDGASGVVLQYSFIRQTKYNQSDDQIRWQRQHSEADLAATMIGCVRARCKEDLSTCGMRER